MKIIWNLGVNMKKVLYIILGLIMLTIGVIGIVVPGLPTTIFLILAAYFFSRGCDKLYYWLINHKTFGPIITNFSKYRGITISDRRKAIFTIWLAIGISIVLTQSVVIGSILFIVAVLHTIFLYKLNVVVT